MKSMPTLRRAWLFAGVLLMLLLALAACSSDNESTPSTTAATTFDGTIRFGEITDLQGPGGASSTVLSHDAAMKSAIADINAKGGVTVAGKHYKLEQVRIDARGDPAAGSTAAASQMLDTQNLVAVYLGNLGADASYQILKTKVISYSASPAVTYHIDSPVAFPAGEGPDNHPLLFSNIDGFAPIVAAHLKMATIAYPSIKNIGFIGSNAPLGKNLSQATQVTGQRLGLTFVGTELVDVGVTDMATQVTSLKAKNPDFVFFATQPSILTAVNAATDGGLAKYYGAWTVRPFDIKTQLKPLGSSVMISPDWRLPFHKNLAPPQYVDAVNKLGALENGQPPNTGWQISQWDFVHLLAQAIEKAGTFSDPNAVAKALIGLSYDSPFGKVNVLDNHTTHGPIGMISKDGSTYTVWGWNSIESVLAGDQPPIKFSAPAAQVEQ
ncbi:MAG TPA: ABC transporter substrate-binding protein [Dehalococcoidia bacterium]|nr:ABC transporter substrate-binding protein [Dehalococcoidia bacterium]